MRKTRMKQHTLLDSFLNTVSIFKLLKGPFLLLLPNWETVQPRTGELTTITA